MNKQWFSAEELAGLPGMLTSARGIDKKAKRENWRPFRDVPSPGRKGRRREYHLSALPKETQNALLDLHMGAYIIDSPTEAQPPAVIAAAAPPATLQNSTAHLKHWQRSTMEARLVILHQVELLEKALGKTNQAVDKVVRLAKRGRLPAYVQQLVAVANARSGGGEGKRTLSRSSIFEWRKLAAQGHAALAPRDASTELGPRMPSWGEALLKAYRKPQKPSLIEAREEVIAQGHDFSYPQARRFIKKMSRLDVQRGRMSPKELKSRKMYITRDTSGMYPMDVALCDGHSFKARVAHPVHGRPFHPEVCAVVDAATRVCIGWSAGLAESAQTVADAVRHACTVNEGKPEGGIPAIFYTDKGAGNMAGVNSADVTGLFARLGIDHQTGIPGNSQGRGLVERIQASLWIRAAKQLPTYTGKGMDGDVARRVYLAVDKDVKTKGKSDLLISWNDFIDFCQQEVDAYNRRPHSALSKITDQTTGKRRHMAPLEMWTKFLAEGWTPTIPAAEEMDDLFRPEITATTRRGQVRLFGNVYEDAALEHYHGTEVIVGYDIHDGSQVWVRDLDRRLICKAAFELNKRSFFPVSKIEQAREQRANRRRKLKERQLEEIELERLGPSPIEISGDMDEEARLLLLPGEEEQRAEPSQEKSNLVEMPEPLFLDEIDMYDHYRRAAKSRTITAEERAKLAEAWKNSKSLRQLMEIEGTTPESIGI